MDDAEVMRHIREDTPLNRVRSTLSGIIGAAEQASMQRRNPSPIQMRATEFAAVQHLLKVMVENGLAVSAEAIRAEIAWHSSERAICEGYAEVSTGDFYRGEALVHEIAAERLTDMLPDGAATVDHRSQADAHAILDLLGRLFDEAQ